MVAKDVWVAGLLERRAWEWPLSRLLMVRRVGAEDIGQAKDVTLNDYAVLFHGRPWKRFEGVL